jgi:hypothetical protein
VKSTIFSRFRNSSGDQLRKLNARHGVPCSTGNIVSRTKKIKRRGIQPSVVVCRRQNHRNAIVVGFHQFVCRGGGNNKKLCRCTVFLESAAKSPPFSCRLAHKFSRKGTTGTKRMMQPATNRLVLLKVGKFVSTSGGTVRRCRKRGAEM